MRTRTPLALGMGLALMATASPAAGAEELRYSTASDAAVVQIVLTLPQALPNVPNPAVLTLIGSDATGFHSGSGGDIATATSYLAGGNLVSESGASPVLSQLSRVVQSTLESPDPASPDAMVTPDNPLGLDMGMGEQRARTVVLERSAEAEGVAGDVKLGSLRSLGLAPALDPVLGPLNGALDELVAEATPVTDALEGVPTLPVIEVPNPLAGVIPGVPPVIETPAVGGPVVSDTVQEIPAQVRALEEALLEGAVLELNAVTSTSSMAPDANSVTNTSGTGALDAKLFGGLVTVSATEATSSVRTSLADGQSTSAATPTVARVAVSDRFGTLLELVAAEKGITAGLLDGSLGQTLDPTARAAVESLDASLDVVLTQLVDLLAQLNAGVRVLQQGTAAHNVAEDGRSASAETVAAQVSLGLATVAPNLVVLSMGKTSASAEVSAAVVEAAPQTPTTPPGVAPPTKLAQTGAETVLPGIAVALLVGAALVRRRRNSTV